MRLPEWLFHSIWHVSLKLKACCVPAAAGRIDGTDTPLPFACPLDHILDLEHSVDKQLDENHFGPHIHFREHSFLSNPRLPAAVNESRVVVEVCRPLPAGEQPDTGCADGSSPARVAAGRVRIRSGLKSLQVLHFTVVYVWYI